MSTYYVAGFPYSSELYHHGIKGQKWGVRRYQNEDGSLTAAGKERYGTIENFKAQRELKESKSAKSKAYIGAINPFRKKSDRAASAEQYRKLQSEETQRQRKANYTDYLWKREKYKEDIKRGRELAKAGFNRELALMKQDRLSENYNYYREQIEERKRKYETEGKPTALEVLNSIGDQIVVESAVSQYEKLDKEIRDYDKYKKYGGKKKKIEDF